MLLCSVLAACAPTVPPPVAPDTAPAPPGDAGIPDPWPGSDAGTVVPPPPVGAEGLAAGVAISGVSAFQTLEVPLGAPSSVPLIAQKPTRIRIAIAVLPGFVPSMLRAVVDVTGPAGARSFEDRRVISASSTPGQPDSYFQIDVDAATMAMGASLSARVLAPAGAPVALGHPALWPSTGALTLTLRAAAPLRIKLVPMHHALSARNAETRLTPERIEAVRRALIAMYPTNEAALEITTRPEAVVVNHARNNDYLPFALDEFNAAHRNDGAPLDQVYYGLISADWDAYPCSECDYDGYAYGAPLPDLLTNGESLVAVGRFGDDVTDARPSWAIEATEAQWQEWAAAAQVPLDVYRMQGEISDLEYSLELMAHEIGHTMTLDHAPCPGYPQTDNGLDVTFPRADGSILLEGFDIRTGRFLSPSYTRDMMSYCELQWVSDHNFRKLSEVMPQLTSRMRTFSAALPTRHVRAVILDSEAHFTGHIELPPPSRDSLRVVVVARDATGRVIDQVFGRVRPMHHERAASFFVPVVAGAVRYEASYRGHPVVVEVPSPTRWMPGADPRSAPMMGPNEAMDMDRARRSRDRGDPWANVDAAQRWPAGERLHAGRSAAPADAGRQRAYRTAWANLARHRGAELRRRSARR